MTATDLKSYIIHDEHGRAWIVGANTRVIEVAMDQYAHGWSAEEIRIQHPHLSMAQIHAALCYYYDHQAAMEAEIEREWREAEALRGKATPSPFAERLRRQGHLL
jgi:uncharacterized protein (DUF433 family)